MKSDWVWMPHPAHLIVGRDCRFHLATYLPNGYIVSTVGEWLPDSATWDIYANSNGVTLEGCGDARRADFMKKVGFIEIGYKRKYETMVFPAGAGTCPSCPYMPTAPWSELDLCGYNDGATAFKGHLKMCNKWALFAKSNNRKRKEKK